MAGALRGFVTSLERFYRVQVIDRWVLGPSIRKFYYLASGHIFFQLLAAAVELDLFTLLRKEGPLTLAALAERLGLAEQPARILLDGLVTIGALKQRGDRYANTLMSQIAFTAQDPRNLRATILWQKHIVYRPMAHLLESLRAYRNCGLEEIPGQGGTLYERLGQHPRLEKIFQDSMQEISIQANDLLARYVDFSATKLLVDVGGGNGTNILAVARRYPRLQGRVFDLPTVCEKARARFREERLADRLDAIEGNVFTDDFPAGADAFLFCHFCCIWSKEENQRFLRKAYERLPVGGRAILFDIMGHDEGGGPLASAMGSPYFLCLATGTGMIYSKREYVDICRQAGFRHVRRVELPREHTAIIATK